MLRLSDDITAHANFAQGISSMTYTLSSSGTTLYTGHIINITGDADIRLNDIIADFVSLPDIRENRTGNFISLPEFSRTFTLYTADGTIVFTSTGTDTETVTADQSEQEIYYPSTAVPLYDSDSYRIRQLISIPSTVANPKLIVILNDGNTAEQQLTETLTSGYYMTNFRGSDISGMIPDGKFARALFLQTHAGQAPTLICEFIPVPCQFRYTITFVEPDGHIVMWPIRGIMQHTEEYKRYSTVNLRDEKIPYRLTSYKKLKCSSGHMFERNNAVWKGIYSSRVVSMFDSDNDITMPFTVDDVQFTEKYFRTDHIFTYDLTLTPIHIKNIKY